MNYIKVEAPLGNLDKIADPKEIVGKPIRMEIHGCWVTIGQIVDVDPEKGLWIGEVEEQFADDLFEGHAFINKEEN